MKKRVLTGLQPTSDNLHLGNYFGAINPILSFQEDNKFETFMFLANMHGLTELHDGKAIRENSFNVLRTYMACGIDPEKTLIYNPANIPAHAKLNWILSCITTIGYMKRMHSYKSAIDKGEVDDTTMGTLNYPILMAADIILYDTEYVPVGADQKQHVEYARDITSKFNNTFGDVFELPKPYIQENIATIPGIDGYKMSKSYNNYIGLFDDDKLILKKIKSIPTASVSVDEPKDPDSCNVYSILKLFLTEKEDKEIRNQYKKGGLSFKYVKDYLYEKVVDFVSPIREKAQDITDQQISDILNEGTKNANAIAESKIKEVYKKVGFDV